MKFVVNKRSGAVVMSPDSEGLGAAVVAGVVSNLTQPSDISYFSKYIFFRSTCIRYDPGPEFFDEVKFLIIIIFPSFNILWIQRVPCT